MIREGHVFFLFVYMYSVQIIIYCRVLALLFIESLSFIFAFSVLSVSVLAIGRDHGVYTAHMYIVYRNPPC